MELNNRLLTDIFHKAKLTNSFKIGLSLNKRPVLIFS